MKTKRVLHFLAITLGLLGVVFVAKNYIKETKMLAAGPTTVHYDANCDHIWGSVTPAGKYTIGFKVGGQTEVYATSGDNGNFDQPISPAGTNVVVQFVSCSGPSLQGPCGTDSTWPMLNCGPKAPPSTPTPAPQQPTPQPQQPTPTPYYPPQNTPTPYTPPQATPQPYTTPQNTPQPTTTTDCHKHDCDLQSCDATPGCSYFYCSHTCAPYPPTDANVLTECGKTNKDGSYGGIDPEKEKPCPNLLFFGFDWLGVSEAGGSRGGAQYIETNTTNNQIYNVSSTNVVILFWKNGPSSCVASGDWSGNKSNPGSEAIVLKPGQNNFKLTCGNQSKNYIINNQSSFNEPSMVYETFNEQTSNGSTKTGKAIYFNQAPAADSNFKINIAPCGSNGVCASWNPINQESNVDEYQVFYNEQGIYGVQANVFSLRTSIKPLNLGKAHSIHIMDYTKQFFVRAVLKDGSIIYSPVMDTFACLEPDPNSWGYLMKKSCSSNSIATPIPSTNPGGSGSGATSALTQSIGMNLVSLGGASADKKLTSAEAGQLFDKLYDGKYIDLKDKDKTSAKNEFVDIATTADNALDAVNKFIKKSYAIVKASGIPRYLSQDAQQEYDRLKSSNGVDSDGSISGGTLAGAGGGTGTTGGNDSGSGSSGGSGSNTGSGGGSGTALEAVGFVMNQLKAINIFPDNIATVPDLIRLIIAIALTFSGLIAVLFIIIGGYQYITSAGNQEQAKKATQTITYAVIGLVVVLAAYLIVNTIFTAIQGGYTN